MSNIMEFQINLLAGIIFGVLGTVGLILSRKKISSIKYLSFFIILWSLTRFLMAFSHLSRGETWDDGQLLLIISAFTFTLTVMSWILFESKFGNENPPWWQFCVIGVLGTLYMASYLFTSPIFVENILGKGVDLTNFTLLGANVIVIFENMIFSYYIINFMIWIFKILRHAGELRGVAYKYLIPTMVISALDVVMGAWLKPLNFPLYLFWYIGAWAWLGTSILIVLTRYPKILYLFFFKLHRLTLIRRDSGIALFNYNFTKQPINENLFSGLIKGINDMSAELLREGNLKEIKVAKSILIFRETSDLMVCLFAKKSSKILHDTLERFVIEFEKQFSKFISLKTGEIPDPEDATNLMKKVFPLVSFAT